jgi:hypothetical protein
MIRYPNLGLSDIAYSAFAQYGLHVATLDSLDLIVENERLRVEQNFCL